MAALKYYANSSIVKKQVMAVTGLLLCGFLLSHLAGNCLIYVGSDAFNLYAHTLISNPLIYLAEAILGAIFLGHLLMALRLTIENKNARPERYYMQQMTGKGATVASRTMIYSGLLTLIFLVFHLLQFKFGPEYGTTVDGVEMRDLYKTVVEYFASPLSVAWYIIAMATLGLHVSHGFWSAFQSMGLSHPKYDCTIKVLSKAFGAFVFLGYSALAIYCHLQGVN